jgi:hypothetical protein
MKRNIFLSALILILLSACGGGSLPSLPGNGSDIPIDHSLSVSGRGSVALAPDLARVSIGVQTENENAALAVDTNTIAADAVMGALEQFAIPPQDIQTANFSVTPVHERTSGGEVISTTFRVQNTVLVTVRDLDTLGAILDAVVSAGANTIQGIRFDLDPATREAAYRQALELAMQDARAQAGVLAAAAGVRLVDVLTLDINTVGGITQDFDDNFLAAGELAGVRADVPISPGQTDLAVQVFVVYEIALENISPVLEQPEQPAPEEPQPTVEGGEGE